MPGHLRTLGYLRTLVSAATLVLGVAVVLTGCSSKPSKSTSSGASAAPPCPTAPINVVASVDQWGDIVSTLGGNCAKVTIVLVSSSVDPHDYEPAPADAELFSHAKLVVVNGVDYDAWASKLAATTVPNAPVVSAAKVTKTPDGANPHLWYNPPAVTAVADAVTAELTKLSPSAANYFAGHRSTFSADLKPYTDLIAKIKAEASGKTYAATESVFDYMAAALGLVNKTPEGYRRAIANETDPSPADIEAFRTALAHRQINVLIYNTQTQGSVPEEIRAAAKQAGVPIVNVTETVAPGEKSFQSWQIDQLDRLAKALGVPT
jgi:zinc/manganese transport system substrate-binding protein